MNQRERTLILKLAEALGETKARLEELEKQVESMKENEQVLYTELKEVYRIVTET